MIKIYNLRNLDCANCAAKMEHDIKKINGVINANVNFMTQKLIIDAVEGDFDFILSESAKLIKKIERKCTIDLGGI